MTSRASALLLCLVLGACGAPRNYVVLLPEPDGKPTALTFTTAAGTARIERPGEAIGATSARAAPEKLDIASDEVQRIFGPALAAAPKPPAVFVLNFHFNTVDLTPESRRRLREILDEIAGRPAPDVAIVGHTDRAGPDDFNLQLGLRRAQAVREAVIGVGVRPAMIEISSHGAANPLVETPPGFSEPRNRRAEVTVR